MVFSPKLYLCSYSCLQTHCNAKLGTVVVCLCGYLTCSYKKHSLQHRQSTCHALILLDRIIKIWQLDSYDNIDICLLNISMKVCLCVSVV